MILCNLSIIGHCSNLKCLQGAVRAMFRKLINII